MSYLCRNTQKWPKLLDSLPRVLASKEHSTWGAISPCPAFRQIGPPQFREPWHELCPQLSSPSCFSFCSPYNFSSSRTEKKAPSKGDEFIVPEEKEHKKDFMNQKAPGSLHREAVPNDRQFIISPGG